MTGGVEVWRGDVGSAYPFAAPFGWRCLNSRTVLRFHTPLVEPGVRFSRTRLPDKGSRVRPWEACRSRLELDQAQLPVQVLVREA